jgi:ABC-type dipeptide/oligopeptide/nickel transport system ATPase component
VRNLRISFRLDRQTTFEAVKGISFDIPRDSTVALVGESGSGKSVTSLAMLGLLPPENSIIDPSSEVLYGGRNLVGLPMGELRKLDNFPATGASVTVYGYRHWNAMITFAPFSTTFRDATRFRQAMPDIVFKLRRFVELEI